MRTTAVVGALVLLWAADARAQEQPAIDPPVQDPDVKEVVGVPDAPGIDFPDGDEPEPLIDTPADEDGDGQPDYVEVLVIGEQVISAARDAVIREMEALGWRARRRGDGSVVFRGPEAWMGRAVLQPTGDIDFSQPALALEGPKNTEGDYSSDAVSENRVNVGTLGVSVNAPSRDKVLAAQRAVRAAVEDEVLDYRQKIQQRYFSSYVAEIPERLDALWERGESLGGGKPVADRAARRAEALEFWSGRADTPEGRTVSRAVEIWLREVVMTSAWPVTREEAARAEAARPDGRRLDIFPRGTRVDGVGAPGGAAP